MSFRNLIVLSLLSVGPALFGCDAEHPRSTDGALAIRVHPASGTLHAAAARGSFSLRGIDQVRRARIELPGGAYQTLHVPLPAGAYELEWEPAGQSALVSADAAAQEVQHQRSEPGMALPRVVVIAASQLTLLDVSTTTPSEFGATPLAFAGEQLQPRRGL